MYLSHLPRDAKITFDQFHIPRYSGVQGNTREKLKLRFYYVKLFRGLAFLLMLLMLSVHSHAFLSRGGGLPIVGYNNYTGRLRPKGVPFVSSQYIEG